ncbi:MAG: hypothetical protein A2655_04755 [Candidatus Yanofskybacteria bacterium RIFCSPHIGHO2_01_FULL_43_42]|nr:MAG: hypothetical protein A2655_04755 [Candidatus Yanofskybacteria bacterium RIFCSPHIGHO2_01_FULL_43_42]
MMERRTQKQLVIGLIFVLLIASISYGLIDYFFLIEATCFDKVQNNSEEGIDCGLLACGVACEPAILPLNVLSQKLIEVRSGDYDFVAQINNPNSFFGTSRAKYTLDFGGVIPNRSGTFYILPGQTRFIIVNGIRSDSTLTSVSINITEVGWEKVEVFENINFPIQRKSYAVVDKNGVFSEFEAVVLNNSDFDFDKVEVGVILSDGDNNIVAANRTDIRTFLSRTERYFKVSWPVALSETARQDIEILTNVFENSNFIKRYGTQERFQKYY